MIKFLATFWASFALTFAETQSPELVRSAVPATEMKTEKDQATVLTGKVISVDPKAGKLTIKTMDREVN